MKENITKNSLQQNCFLHLMYILYIQSDLLLKEKILKAVDEKDHTVNPLTLYLYQVDEIKLIRRKELMFQNKGYCCS